MQEYIYIQSNTMPGRYYGRRVDLGKVNDTPENRAELLRVFNCSIQRPYPVSQYLICSVFGMRKEKRRKK